MFHHCLYSRLLTRSLLSALTSRPPSFFKRAVVAARSTFSTTSVLQRLANSSEVDIEKSLASICERRPKHTPAASITALSEKLCCHRINRFKVFNRVLEYVMKFDQPSIMPNLLGQFPDLLPKAQQSDLVKLVYLIGEYPDFLPREHVLLFLDRVAGLISFSDLESCDIAILFAAMSRFPFQHHGLILATNCNAAILISKLSLCDIAAVSRSALTEFNKDSSLIQEISNRVSKLLASTIDQEHIYDVMSIFVLFARNTLFNPELANAAVKLFPSIICSMTTVDKIRLTESVSRFNRNLIKAPEFTDHFNALTDLHHYLVRMILPDLPLLSFRSISMLLSSFQRPHTNELVEGAKAICDRIVNLPNKINSEFVGAFCNSISIARLYHPAVLDRLFTDMTLCMDDFTGSEECFSRFLFGMAMLRYPIPKQCHVVIPRYASHLLANTSDPGCLVRVLWALAVYDLIVDPELALSSIYRLEGVFTRKHFSYCHDILHHILPTLSTEVTESPEFTQLFMTSRRIRSRLYPGRNDFKSKFCEALDAAGIPYVRNSRVCQSGYRFDVVLEYKKTVFSLDDKECFVVNGSHLIGTEYIARQFLRNSLWSVIQIPYWDWSTFEGGADSILQMLPSDWEDINT